MRVTRSTIIATVLTVTALGLGVFTYVNSFKKNLMNNAYLTVQQKVEEKSLHIEDSVNYAQSSIKLLASFAGEKMQGREIIDLQEVIGTFTDKTPFSSVEYIRWDGLNKTGEPGSGMAFIARDREYYKKGIKGISGVWPNFRPKYAKEVLVNFYTPLIYQNEIVGVLTGIVGGQTDYAPILESSFYGYPIVFVLTDDKLNVISSTSEDIPPATYLERYADSKIISDIIQHSEEKNSRPFKYIEEGKEGICCVTSINSTGWRLIGIVLPKSLSSTFNDVKSRTYAILLFILVVLLIYLGVRFYIHDQVIKQDEHEKYMENLIDHQSTQISVLSSFSGIYYSAHLVDISKDTVVEINSAPALRTVLNDSSNVQKQMTSAMNLTVTPQNLEEMLAFTNFATVGKRLKDKKIISKEFKGKTLGWMRASFISVEADDSHIPFKVLFVTQIIDDEKRRVETLIDSANKDELTGLYNRHAYETDLSQFKANMPDGNFIYASFDVNGLKTVNDNYGHEAGDELIRGAALCLSKAFGSYGKVYRTGGDEFQAVIFIEPEIFEDVRNIFEHTVESWSGNLVEEMYISAGYVTYSDNRSLTISEIAKLADQRMYKAKSAFYTSKGIDRRGQQVAFEVLCQSYTKLLKVNLTKDSYTVLQMDNSEKVSDKGFSDTISAWLKNFAKAGQVHPEDIDKFLEKTNLEYVRNYFMAGNKILNIKYRRKIEESFHHVLMEIIPVKDFSDGNQEVYLYVKDID